MLFEQTKNPSLCDLGRHNHNNSSDLGYPLHGNDQNDVDHETETAVAETEAEAETKNQLSLNRHRQRA